MQSLSDMLICPVCQNDKLEFTHCSALDVVPKKPRFGLYLCPGCGRWYPLDDSIVCMLPDTLRNRERDEAFLKKYHSLLGDYLFDKCRSAMLSWESCEEKVRLLAEHDRNISTGEYLKRAENKNHTLKIEAVLHELKDRRSCVLLEAGCGGGTHAAALLKNDPGIQYVGIDISYALLRETLKLIGESDKILLVQASLETLPFRADHFHAGFTVSVFQYLDNPAVGMEEIRRVLRGEGILVSLDFNRECYATRFRRVDVKYDKMTKGNMEEWVKQSRFTNVKTRHILYTPSFLPLPLFLYRAINSLLSRIPFLKRFSIMLFTRAEKPKK